MIWDYWLVSIATDGKLELLLHRKGMTKDYELDDIFMM